MYTLTMFLNDITEIQKTTSPIVLSIGYSKNNIVQSNVILIKEASCLATNKMIDFCARNGILCSIIPEGMLLDFRNDN